MIPKTNFALRLRILKLADEEDRQRARWRRRCPLRGTLWSNANAFQFPEEEFIKTFRLGKATVKQLVLDLLPFMPRVRRIGGIPATMKILITLAFYATGSRQTIVSQNAHHSVSQTSVSRAVRQVTEALNNPSILEKYLKWPMHIEEKNNIKARFNQFRLPDVLGCIDCTHVAIVRPYVNEELYINGKGYHSLNVMVICDSDLNIMCVDSSSPGSTQDSRVWQSHQLSQHLLNINNNGEQAFILGDNGFRLSKTMMTPILNTVEGTPQHYFNELHATAHNVVERCIAMLKARFRCLLANHTLHYEPVMASKIVNACCVLHNIANRSGAPAAALTARDLAAESLIEEQFMGVAEGCPARRDLVAGRAAQRALVAKLWEGRNA